MTGANKIPTEVKTFIRGTNTTQETQATNTAEREAETIITDPKTNPATGDETATPGQVNVTYNNQTWTAGASGPINFREKTVINPFTPNPPGFTNSQWRHRHRIGRRRHHPRQIRLRPGQRGGGGGPSTIEINTAPAFASVAVNNTANRAPTANAGPDQSVASKQATVTLNGFESSDGSEESFALKYNWTQTAARA